MRVVLVSRILQSTSACVSVEGNVLSLPCWHWILVHGQSVLGVPLIYSTRRYHQKATKKPLKSYGRIGRPSKPTQPRKLKIDRWQQTRSIVLKKQKNLQPTGFAFTFPSGAFASRPFKSSEQPFRDNFGSVVVPISSEAKRSPGVEAYGVVDVSIKKRNITLTWASKKLLPIYNYKYLSL